jgi:hypothetical protein
VPTDLVSNARNDIYLIGEALKLIDKKKLLPMEVTDLKAVTDYHKVDNATKFIPIWVKVAFALALSTVSCLPTPMRCTMFCCATAMSAIFSPDMSSADRRQLARHSRQHAAQHQSSDRARFFAELEPGS